VRFRLDQHQALGRRWSPAGLLRHAGRASGFSRFSQGDLDAEVGAQLCRRSLDAKWVPVPRST